MKKHIESSDIEIAARKQLQYINDLIENDIGAVLGKLDPNLKHGFTNDINNKLIRERDALIKLLNDISSKDGK